MPTKEKDSTAGDSQSKTKLDASFDDYRNLLIAVACLGFGNLWQEQDGYGIDKGAGKKDHRERHTRQNAKQRQGFFCTVSVNT